jgi:hypothetical protein
MPQNWNGVTPADLRRRISETQPDLERLVHDRRRMRRDVSEREAVKYAYDLAIYAANSRVETCALLLAKLEMPSTQHVWDRYLTVYLHAAIDAFPQLASKLIRECRRLHAEGHTVIDEAGVSRAYQVYKVGMKRITSDRDFMQTLEDVRNRVGAHHLTLPHNGIDGLIEWIEVQSNPRQPPSESLVTNTLRWSMQSVQFGRDAFAALNVSSLPPIPRSREYLQLVNGLDEQARLGR